VVSRARVAVVAIGDSVARRLQRRTRNLGRKLKIGGDPKHVNSVGNSDRPTAIEIADSVVRGAGARKPSRGAQHVDPVGNGNAPVAVGVAADLSVRRSEADAEQGTTRQCSRMGQSPPNVYI
jgi:hypothetical protein